jgi:exosome complex component RRP41
MATLLDPIVGLRVDGRKPNELRRIQCEVGVFAQADGSASISQGNTKVIATVYGPHEVIIISLNKRIRVYQRERC